MDGDELPRTDALGDQPDRVENVKHKRLHKPARVLLRRAVVPLGLLVLVGACILIILGAYVTHGFLWSIYTPIYDHLLRAVPTPPDLLPETDKLSLNPELPWGYRKYWVDEDHLEVVNFLTAALSQAGWDRVEHGTRSIERESGSFLKVDDMLLVTRQPYWFKQYWLIVEVYTDYDAGGVRIGNALVTLEVHGDGEIAKSRYRP